MHPIGPLVNQHRYWSVARGLRHTLRHILHDQRIADQETLRLRRSKTAFAAHYSTGIELHEQHQPGRADAPLHHAFEFGIGGGAPGRLHEFRHVRSADRRFAATTVSNDLDDVMVSRSISILRTVMDWRLRRRDTLRTSNGICI